MERELIKKSLRSVDIQRRCLPSSSIQRYGRYHVVREPRRSKRLAHLCLGLLMLTACSTIHKMNDLGNSTGTHILSIDAKQRVVVTERKSDNSSITCAEPSPDALSALSTSLSASAQTNTDVIAKIAGAVSESSASIGLRTQSIQLLRDGMYRLCEAYAGGAITADDFNRQQRRYQNLMLSLLAIEQLTGAVVARQVVLGDGSASSSVGGNAATQAQQVTTATKAVSDAQAALDKATSTQTGHEKACTASGDSTNSNCKAASDDKVDVATKTADLQTAKTELGTAQKALEAAQSAVNAAASGAKGSFSAPSSTPPISDTSARFVSEATRTIVSTTLLASFAQEECTRLWDSVQAFQSLQAVRASSSSSSSAPSSKGKQGSNTSGAPGNTSGAAGKPSDTTEIENPTLQSQTYLEFLGHSGTSTSSGGSGSSSATKTSVTKSPSDEALDSLVSGCTISQTALLKQASMFTPQYDGYAPLSVLGGRASISLAPEDAARDFRIVGGQPGYQIYIDQTFKPGTEIIASSPTQQGNAYVFRVLRPPGAAQEGSVTVSVVDSTNAHFDISIVLAKASAPAKSAAAPVSNGESKPGAPTIKVVESKVAGTLFVTFDAPSDGGSPITGYKATADNVDPEKKNDMLSGKATAKSTSLNILKCTPGDEYTIIVTATNKNGDGAPSKASNKVKCAADAATPELQPPTKLQVKSLAKTLVLSFDAPSGKTSKVTEYLGTAINSVKKDEQLKGTSDGLTPGIVIPNCTVGQKYDLSVVAKYATGISTALTSKEPFTCAD